MKKVVLFTSSAISWSLISYLIEIKRLSAVVTIPNNNPQFIQMMEYLQQNKITIYQQPKELEEGFIKVIQNLKCSFALCFSYPKILPIEIIELFEDGIFNIHPSALPKYKGANPLYWQIREGIKHSAISIHKITQKIDSGDIAYSFKFEIEKEVTLGALANKVSMLVPSVLAKFLNDFDTNTLKYLAQKEQEKQKNYHNPTDKDFIIDWKNDTRLEIIQKIKASNPLYGGVQTTIKESLIKLFEASISNKPTHGVKEGIIISIDEKEGLIVSGKDGAVKLEVISTVDGIFSGYSYANFTKLFSGDKFI